VLKNKQGLVMLLIDEFAPVTKTTILIVRCLVSSGKLVLHALSTGYHTIG